MQGHLKLETAADEACGAAAGDIVLFQEQNLEAGLGQT
jgi:hypothetical protein